VEDEAPPRLDRAAMMHGAIGRLTRVDVQLLQKAAEAQAGSLVPYADADGAILVMYAKRNHCPLETRIGHSGHRQQQLARQETRLVHALANEP
jgi:hypothetical protein